MSPFYDGLLIGIFIGANVGIIVLSLYIVAKEGKCQSVKI